jgi:ferredoxin--NADP+ reductase
VSGRGQYATLGIDGSDGLAENPYSIVSRPDETELEFFVKLVPRGALTDALYRPGTGDGVLLRPRARGRFTLSASSERTRHVMVCTVIGIGPFISMLRDLNVRACGCRQSGSCSIEARQHPPELASGRIDE